MQLVVSELKDNLVAFKVHRILNAKALWINKKELSKYNSSEIDAALFAEKYSYAIQGNEFFESITFDDTDEKIAFAERYGGTGIGTHAGGSRCGNIEDVQVKGIGKNPLASPTQDHWHSYGGLNLVDAILEAINAGVFGNVLPIGVANIYGIILTGKTTAMLPGMDDRELNERRSYGALLIRENCIRPAHFFPAPFFKPNRHCKNRFISDYARVRNANILLAEKLQENESFSDLIKKYLDNHANQFAFARVARIAHGSLSSSNICLDGRWLDLTNTTFVDGAKNISGRTSFYGEPEAIMEIFDELIHNFSKYNCINITSTEYLEYFTAQYKKYFTLHISYVIGINITDINKDHLNTNILFLGNVFQKIIGSAKTVTNERPYEYKIDDPVICFIEGMFISLVSPETADYIFDASIPHISNRQEIIGNFLEIMKFSLKNRSCNLIDFKSFVIFTAITAIKRALITEYFFMGRLEGYIYEAVKNKKEELFEDIIVDSISTANWAFNINNSESLHTEKSENHQYNVVIFKSKALKITFDATKTKYFIFDASNSQLFSSEKYEKILNEIKDKDEKLTISGYSFLKYLTRLDMTLQILEKL